MLQAFLAAWAQACDTFGEAVPQTGEQFDGRQLIPPTCPVNSVAARCDSDLMSQSI